jgi:hypothetical protein
MSYMTSERNDTSEECAAFNDLLVESGLVSSAQLARASIGRELTGAPIDSVLILHRVVDPDVLRSVLAHAWNRPAINLARTHVDHDLVDQWPDEVYLSQHWFPVRDQANGTVLVATSRIPDASRAEGIEAVIGAPVEFVVVVSVDIAGAVARATKRRTRGRRLFIDCPSSS